MLAVVKEVFVNSYTLYVYPKPYKSQVWRMFTDNKKFIAGNCVDYDLKSKTVKKVEFQNCVECLSPFPWTDRLIVSLRMFFSIIFLYFPNLTYYFQTCGKCCEGSITEDGAIMNITRKKYQHGQGIYLQIEGKRRTFSTAIFENSALYEPT